METYKKNLQFKRDNTENSIEDEIKQSDDSPEEDE